MKSFAAIFSAKQKSQIRESLEQRQSTRKNTLHNESILKNHQKKYLATSVVSLEHVSFKSRSTSRNSLASNIYSESLEKLTIQKEFETQCLNPFDKKQRERFKSLQYDTDKSVEYKTDETHLQSYQIPTDILNASETNSGRASQTIKWYKTALKNSYHTIDATKKQRSSSFTQYGSKFVIYPYNQHLYYWDIWMHFLLLWTLLFLPLHLTDLLNGWPLLLAIANLFDMIVSDCFFMADVLVGCLRSFYTEAGYLESDMTQIIWHYFISGWLIIDFLAAVPFGHIFRSTKYFIILGALKVLRLHKLKQLFEDLETSVNIAPMWLKTSKLLCILGVMNHWFACAWYFVGDQNRPGWIDNGMVKYDHKHGQLNYMSSYYFVLTTLSTVGYGDISPTNLYELLMTMFFMIVGATSFSIFTASMVSIVHQIDDKSMEFRQKLADIKNSIQKCGISPELAQTITYLVRRHHKTKNRKGHLEKGLRDTFPEFSSTVLHDIAIRMTDPNILNGPFLRQFCECPYIVCELVLQMKSKVMHYSELICTKGQEPKHLYIISQGKIGFELENQRIIEEISENQWFGTVPMFISQVYLWNVVCIAHGSLTLIASDTFIKILSGHSGFLNTIKLNAYDKYESLYDWKKDINEVDIISTIGEKIEKLENTLDNMYKLEKKLVKELKNERLKAREKKWSNSREYSAPSEKNRRMSLENTKDLATDTDLSENVENNREFSEIKLKSKNISFKRN